MQFPWNNLLSKKQRCDTKERKKNIIKTTKKVLKGRAKNKYRELSEEDKNIKRVYGGNRYKNMSKEDKAKLKNIKKIIVIQKNQREAKKLLNFMDLIVYAMI